MFGHPSLSFVDEPDVNRRVRFRIDSKRAEEAIDYLISQLTVSAEPATYNPSVLLENPPAGPEGVTSFEAVGSPSPSAEGQHYRFKEGGHGWSGDWRPIDQHQLRTFMLSLVPYNVEEVGYFTPSRPRPPSLTGRCVAHPRRAAVHVCPACGRELCSACAGDGLRAGSWCPDCSRSADDGQRRALRMDVRLSATADVLLAGALVFRAAPAEADARRAMFGAMFLLLTSLALRAGLWWGTYLQRVVSAPLWLIAWFPFGKCLLSRAYGWMRAPEGKLIVKTAYRPASNDTEPEPEWFRLGCRILFFGDVLAAALALAGLVRLLLR